MADPQIRHISNALLVFADIIDSSKFSSILGYTEYAKRLIEFRQLFTSLGKRYFPPPEDKVIDFCEVDGRGDEGTLFRIVSTEQEREISGFVFVAIQFLFHLKGLLYFKHEEIVNGEVKKESPLRMSVGAGIHVGPVALVVGGGKGKSEISNIEGFSINKAKRVEASSRQGKYSGIVLSKEARDFLEGYPVAFSPIISSMKGIEESAETYEVQSGLFDSLILERGNLSDENLITQTSSLADYPREITESWMKALVISVLDARIKSPVASKEHKANYWKQQLNLAWHSILEDDAVLLYIRSRDYEKQGKRTQQIRYLKELLELFPDFAFARKHMVEAFWEIAKGDDERAEKILARDFAEEFLERFSGILSEEEKNKYSEILKEIAKQPK